MSAAFSCTVATVPMTESFIRRPAAVAWTYAFLASLLDSSLIPKDPNSVPPTKQANFVLAYAGLRISECLELRMEDVSLQAREITVRHGKGDKMRVVYFGDKVVNAVREYLRSRPKTENPYLFPGRGNSHLTRGQVNRIFNAHSTSITPHTLRHFFCSNALENGYSIGELANQAGHSNIHTTLLYTNPTREKMKEKANML